MIAPIVRLPQLRRKLLIIKSDHIASPTHYLAHLLNPLPLGTRRVLADIVNLASASVVGDGEFGAFLCQTCLTCPRFELVENALFLSTTRSHRLL